MKVLKIKNIKKSVWNKKKNCLVTLKQLVWDLETPDRGWGLNNSNLAIANFPSMAYQMGLVSRKSKHSSF